ncbi:unnamed protein product, partial [Hapterophycus canaliculatus]
SLPAKDVKDGDPERRLYKIAARNLREYHGVPSMTPAKLTKTLTLLKLNARCLVKQGLAPRKLLGRIKATKGAKHQHVGDEGNEDLAEYAASGVDVMASDDAKEWNDGFTAVDQPASGCEGAIISSSSDDENDENAGNVNSSTDDDDEGGDPAAAAAAGDAPAAVKNPLHKAFVDGGVQLRPREVRPLLLALAVKPCRLVRLGLVDAKDLRAVLHAERKKASKRNGGRGRSGFGMGNPGLHYHPHHHHMVRGGPPHAPFPRGGSFAFTTRGGGGGDRGAGGRMIRLHYAHPPPPPPPHMEKDDGGMFYGPVGVVGGGRGRRGGRGCPPSHPSPH